MLLPLVNRSSGGGYNPQPIDIDQQFQLSSSNKYILSIPINATGQLSIIFNTGWNQGYPVLNYVSNTVTLNSTVIPYTSSSGDNLNCTITYTFPVTAGDTLIYEASVSGSSYIFNARVQIALYESTRTYLYYRGSQNIQWLISPKSGTTWNYAGYALNQAQLQSDRVFLRSYTQDSSYSIFITADKINLTDYTRLKCRFIPGTAVRNAYGTMYLNNDLSNINQSVSPYYVQFQYTSATGEIEVSFDITNVNTSYYIALSSDNLRNVYITEVWVE